MARCPICNYELLENICPQCYYDRRRDFVDKRTVAPVLENDRVHRAQSTRIAELVQKMKTEQSARKQRAQMLAQYQQKDAEFQPQQEDPEELYRQGLRYETGDGVAQDDGKALNLYRRAAELGHADAQMKLGYFYHNGKGTSQNYTEAVKWHRKAAEQGLSVAQYNLGICCQYGQGTPRVTGKRWNGTEKPLSRVTPMPR